MADLWKRMTITDKDNLFLLSVVANLLLTLTLINLYESNKKLITEKLNIKK